MQKTISGYIFTLFLLFLNIQIQAQSFILTKYKVLEGYPDDACWVSFSSKGTYNTLTLGNSEIQLRDNDFNTVWSYKSSFNAGAGKAVFSPDEKHLIFTKYQNEGDFVVMNIVDKKIIQRIDASRDIQNLALSPDGNTLITTCRYEGKINVFARENNQFVLSQTVLGKTLDNSRYEVGSISISGDGKLAVTYAKGKQNIDTVLVYNLVNSKIQLQQKLIQKSIISLAIHPSGKYFEILTEEGLITYKLEKNTFSKKSTFTNVKYPKGVSFDPTGKYLVANLIKGIKIFNWNNGDLKELTYLEMHTRWIVDVQFSTDQNYLVTTSIDKSSIVWQMPNVLQANAPVKKTLNENNKKSGEHIKQNNDISDFKPSVTGKIFLYIVGINNYKYWTPLINASKDAKDVKNILTTRYTFDPGNVFEVYNDDATVKNILAKLTEVRQKLSGNDNLLIYFSGHGHYNSEIEEGFWIPVDAKKGQETEYLANSTLLKYIKAIPAKHIFLVADACFSGSLFSHESRGYVENVEQYKSRWALTSGRLEYVSDGQAGKNSPFAGYFLKYLKENQKKKFPVSELVLYVKNAVGNNSEQQPIGNPLKSVGDEGGEFIFYLK